MKINIARLLDRLQRLGEVGALPGGGCCRIALTDEDKLGRDLVCGWMRALDLEPFVDQLGNVVAVGKGRHDLPPVMIGSHIDTVGTGGLYDGNYGVLSGLEIVETLRDHGVVPDRPLAVAFFTNEEGVRFQPDMMGSMVYGGSIAVEEAWASKDEQGHSVRDELARIGYLGELKPGWLRPHAYLEAHIEQGPVLERMGITLGSVTGVQGISWQEVTLIGTSNHAGTTPMDMRKDAGSAAAELMVGVRALVREMGGHQVGTCGMVRLEPNLINVIPRKAVLSIDLRNTDEMLLREAERRCAELIERVAQAEGVAVSTRQLVRLEPAHFSPNLIELVEQTATKLGYSSRRMASGAGHDAGLLSRFCPVGMIFTPSVGGLSHNVQEFTKPADLEAGANVLLHTVLALAKAD